MNYGLTEEQQEKVRTILRSESAVASAVVFGSRAMGTYSPASDVDIALIGDTISLRDQIRLSGMLKELGALHYDLVRYSVLTNEKLIEHIKKHGREIYRREIAAEVA